MSLKVGSTLMFSEVMLHVLKLLCLKGYCATALSPVSPSVFHSPLLQPLPFRPPFLAPLSRARIWSSSWERRWMWCFGSLLKAPQFDVEVRTAPSSGFPSATFLLVPVYFAGSLFSVQCPNDQGTVGFLSGPPFPGSTRFPHSPSWYLGCPYADNTQCLSGA